MIWGGSEGKEEGGREEIIRWSRRKEKDKERIDDEGKRGKMRSKEGI